MHEGDASDDAEYIDLNLSDVRAGDAPWRRRRFVRCGFVEADLRGLVTESCAFDECDFTGADLGDSVHRGSAFRPARSCRPRSAVRRSAAARCWAPH